jgi:hypothetical protein
MNVHQRLLVVGTLILLGTAPLAAAEPDSRAIEFFEKKIRPVLVEHCYACHSEEARKAGKLKGGLLLDSAAGIRKGGASGASFVPGKAADSILIKALRYDELRMPPRAKLADAVVADFETWVTQGAPLPSERDLAGPAKSLDWDEARRFWAFQPPVKYPHPAVHDPSWPKKDSDFFVLAELEKQGLHPVRPASKRELLRRATFDLIGLPPTPEEMDAFLADNSPEAFARVVDRLLASPHYGERWSRYWLDVARYADDRALAVAKPFPHAYRYRDWVVQAFNQDMPYDQFLRLQLAGDLMPATIDPVTRLSGLGFQGLGAEYHKGNFAAQVMADELDDRVDTLTRGLLGLTVACARCHDHKYDPIPTRDYYSLAAAYQGASMSEMTVATPEVAARFQAWDKERKDQEASLAQWLQERSRSLGRSGLEDLTHTLLVAQRVRVLRERKQPCDVDALARQEKLSPFLLKRVLERLGNLAQGPVVGMAWLASADRARAEVSDASMVPDDLWQASNELHTAVLAVLHDQDCLERDFEEALLRADPKDKGQIRKGALPGPQQALLQALWLDPRAPFFVDGREMANLLEGADRDQLAERRTRLDQHRKAAPSPLPMIHGVQGGGQAMRVHVRGRVDNPGEESPPGFLRILTPVGGIPSPGQRFTRLELADAIATPRNPLTARVFVNRVWQHHFGRGIVSTPNNFGRLGERPTHPELLDTLAVRFMESGWSVKGLHRELMLSAAYQLSSDNEASNAGRDPENLYLWRMSPHRLDVEAWRDALLAVSGRLDRTMGGPSLELNGPKGGAKNVRRTLYALVSRSVPDAMLTTFDFPDANVTSDRRTVTTVPQQQLFVLNSDFMVETARAFAGRLEKAEANEERRLILAFRLAFGRDPTAREQTLGHAFLQAAAAQRSPEDKLTPWEQYAQALLATNEFAWVD